MTTKQAHRETAVTIRAEMLGLIEGMGYCLDWKPDPDQWSARQVIYHLLETPPGGLAPILRGIFFGSLREFDLCSAQDNVTPERRALDMELVEGDIGQYFQDLENAIQASHEEDFTGKFVLAHLKSRDRDKELTAQKLLEGLFARHWREHLVQLRELRESLGI